MSSEEISEFLYSLKLCTVCVLRYTNKLNFVTIVEATNCIKTGNPKKKRPNTCVACLGIFQEIDTVINEIIKNSNLSSYDSRSLYTSISIPITILIRELSIWISLVQKFPGKIDFGKNESVCREKIITMEFE